MKYRVGIRLTKKGWEVFTEKSVNPMTSAPWIKVGNPAFFKLRESAEFYRKQVIVNYQKIRTN